LQPDLFDTEDASIASSDATPASGIAEPLMTDVTKTMNPEDAFAILNGDMDAAVDGEIFKPVRPKGGEVYFFTIESKDTFFRHLKFVSGPFMTLGGRVARFFLIQTFQIVKKYK
jgi:hypothetical protein